MPEPNPTPHGRLASLRWQILVWLVACAMVPLLAMALQGYHCARQAILDLETTRLRSLLESRNARIVDWVEERQHDLLAVGADPCAWQDGETPALPTATDGESCHLVHHLCSADPALGAVAVYDPAWRRIATGGSAGHADEELVPAIFRTRVEEADRLVVGPVHTHGAGSLGIHLGIAVADVTGERLGYVVASVSLSNSLYPIVEDRRGLPASTKAYIVSPTGQLWSAPRPHMGLPAEALAFPPGFLAGSWQRAASYRDTCGNPVLGMPSPMPELGWVLVAEVNRSEAFAWLVALRRRAEAAGLVVLIGVIMLGMGGAAVVARPFHRLRDAAVRVAAGRHEERVARLDNAEAQEVAIAFNGMLDELAAYAQRLANAGALAAVGQLSSSIVHEMRNPLSSIKLNLGAVREALPDGSDDRELADIALGEATRVERMLNGLLAYGKPLDIRPQPTPVGRLVQRAMDHGRAACRERSLHLDIGWNGQDQTLVAVDEEQMLGALCNLIDNAVSFAPEGGTVELAVSVPADAPHAIEISVRDRGPGIRPEHVGKVFDPFFTTRDRGTGLGLANAKKVVACHGGALSGGNHPAGGAVFVLRLPTEEGHRE